MTAVAIALFQCPSYLYKLIRKPMDYGHIPVETPSNHDIKHKY